MYNLMCGMYILYDYLECAVYILYNLLCAVYSLYDNLLCGGCGAYRTATAALAVLSASAADRSHL